MLKIDTFVRDTLQRIRHGSKDRRRDMRRIAIAAMMLAAIPLGSAVAGPHDYRDGLRTPPPDPNEPRRAVFSPVKAAEYLDIAAQDWMLPRSCGGCHTNFAYMMARPMLSARMPSIFKETRRYLETRIETEYQRGGHVATHAAALVIDDARTGRLRPITRKTLARMWDRQQSDGRRAGTWGDHCEDPQVAEFSMPYSLSLALMAVDLAPDKYADTPAARQGLARVREYFSSVTKEPDRSKEGTQFMLLWASAHLQGSLTDAVRQRLVKDLLAKQNKDGGWSSVRWESEVAARGKDPSSDGYGTGLSVYVLRKAGVPADRPELVRAIAWLKSNQRVSGRWYTPGPPQATEEGFGTRDFYSQSVGTAFAVLALESCGQLPGEPPLLRFAGLAQRARLDAFQP
jgi:squalene-hopene/tetraprenyl-beta-curcumene cyclase